MNDGTKDYSATYQFTYVSTPVSAIVLDSVPENLTVVRGTKAQLTAHVMPLDADVQTFTWSSSNTELATIDADGNITVASNLSAFTDDERKVTFTATSTSNADVKVTTSEITLVAPVESISITNAVKDLFVNGLNGFATEQLTITYAPADVSESEKGIAGAYSDDTGVATVDASLLVTATGSGNTNITVEGKNGTSAKWNATVYSGDIYYGGSDSTRVVTGTTVADDINAFTKSKFNYTMKMNPTLPSCYTYNWSYKWLKGAAGSGETFADANSPTASFTRTGSNYATYEFVCTIKKDDDSVYSLSFQTYGKL